MSSTTSSREKGSLHALEAVRPVSPAGPGRADAGRERTRRAEMLTGFSQLLASQALVGVAGLISLPILTRNLGAAGYGRFSLFVTLLAVVCYVDVSRPLLVREYARRDGRDELLAVLAAGAPWFMTLAAAAVAVWVFPPAVALPFALACGLYGASSPHFAALAAQGHVGVAGGVRNVVWATAWVVVAVLSFASVGPAIYSWTFLVANLAIFAVLRHLSSAQHRRMEWARIRDTWTAFRSAIGDLLAFNLGVGVLNATDRVLLDKTSSGAEFGQYVAHADLAVKLNVLGTGLMSVLYPLFSRSLAEEDPNVSAQRFVRIASWVATLWFLGIAGLMFFEKEVVGLLLGSEFLEHSALYSVILVGVFVNVFGYLLTPWQRARGDFASQRTAYNAAAAAMVVCGVVMIPAWGTIGAVLTYLVARSAEVVLFLRELPRMRAFVPTWKLVSLAGMLLTLSSWAASRVGEVP